MNLYLPNTLEIIDADKKVLAFMKAEYDLYDGIPVEESSTLTLFDILLSIMMNSRLDTADKVRNIWEHRKSVEKILERIPRTISLQDEHIPWDDLKELFKAFCDIQWAGPAVATKILYKKRPFLIPIFDNVIITYINAHNTEPLLPRGSHIGVHLERGVKYFRYLLRNSLDQIEQIRQLPEMACYLVSPVRILEVLLWIENENRGIYRNNLDSSVIL